MVLGEALGAELAAVDWMVRVAPCGDGLVVAYAQKHAASDRAVAAGGLDPSLRDTRRSGVAEGGIFGVGVLIAADVDSGEALELSEKGTHACTDPTKVRAMLSGTTETKKR